jgi:uncharacterized OsmC-like protein
MSTIPGIDKKKLADFGAAANADPSKVRLGLEATTIWEGHGVENLCKIGPWELAGERIDKRTRDYSVQLGAWKEVEEAIGIPGAHDRIEPMEAALAGIASCVSTAITLNSARNDVPLTGLEVTAKVVVDPRVLLGAVPASEVESCIQQVDIAIKAEGDLSADQRKAILEMAKRSPVHAMVSGKNKVNTTIN